MSSAVYLFINRYTDITPALCSEREAEESSLMGGRGVLLIMSRLCLPGTQPRTLSNGRASANAAGVVPGNLQDRRDPGKPGRGYILGKSS